jgi:hypothetical protein
MNTASIMVSEDVIHSDEKNSGLSFDQLGTSIDSGIQVCVAENGAVEESCEVSDEKAVGLRAWLDAFGVSLMVLVFTTSVADEVGIRDFFGML